jgi:hypothetical protein
LERISFFFCFVLRGKDKSVKSVWRLAWGRVGGGGRGGLAGLYGGRRETIAQGKGKLCHLQK